ncbi:MAG: hypothetical protein JOZ22_03700 [Acidobacteriia bacterium]|nr:hypothetical protein [Terriglobia bacterium]
MEPTSHHLNLCTFEVATHLGLHKRLGAHKEGRVLDLNFATAWYLAQTGEPDPQPLADALVPPSMMGYLRSGLRASHTAEELFLGAGPHPADWWRRTPAPRGPNNETLVYPESDVRLLGVFGRSKEVAGPAECRWEVAAVAAAGATGPDAPRPILGGYTLVIRCANRKLLGPYLITPNQIPHPSGIAWIARVNGSERATGIVGRDLKVDHTSLRPGEYTGTGPLGSVLLQPGDEIEVEADRIGVLRQRASAA